MPRTDQVNSDSVGSLSAADDIQHDDRTTTVGSGAGSPRVQRHLLAVAFAVVGAVVAAQPTGVSWFDHVLAAAVVGAAAWLGWAAPPIVLAVAAAGAAVASVPRWEGVIVATLALGCAALDLAHPSGPNLRRGLAAGATAAACFLLPPIAVFGGSAVVGGVITALVIVSGWWRTGGRVRRRATWAAAALVLLTIGAVAGFGASALSARDSLKDGLDSMRAAVRALKAGDLDAARVQLNNGAAALRDADDSFGSPLAAPSALVPVVAQNRTALVDLVGNASEAVGAASDAINLIDTDQIRLAGGQFDLAAIADLAAPMQAVSDAIVRLDATIGNVRSPWLVSPVTERLDELDDELVDYRRQAANLATATRLAPDMLGANGPRQYFIAFITPAEARSLGGYMGSYGILTADDGRLTLDQFGSTISLNDTVTDPTDRIITVAPEYTDRYAGYGAGDGVQPAAPDWWQVVSISPDFPSVASVIRELYANGVEIDVDGVIGIDPSGLAALLDVTGPVTIAATGQELDADNAVQFIQRGQYELLTDIENEDRRELLSDVAAATFDRLLTIDIDPLQLVRALSPTTFDGHVMLWSTHDEEEALFAAVNADGDFRAPASTDAFALTHLNAGGNKIDAFLRREIDYDATYDRVTGAVRATVTVTMHNDAPASGLPDYVLANYTDDPLGTNRMRLVMYSSDQLANLDAGDAASGEVLTGSELGWSFAEQEVVLGPGQSTTLVYTLEGALAPGSDYSLTLLPRALATPDVMRISVVDTDGASLLAFDGVLERPTVLRAEP